ncbi:MAG: hypothetical protein WA739_24065, partial [Candidatus Acidiferrales bacterium]
MKNSSITKLCVALAFVPGLISVIIIALDIGLPNWVLVLTVDLPAFLWFGITLIHYRRIRTTSAAWLFALLPIAFFEPGLLAYLWFSSLH